MGSVIEYANEDEAVAIANDTVYGLGAGVFSTDLDHADRLARRARAGTVNINRHITDFCLPFGGWKQSGIGREGGPEAVASYLETKVIGPHARPGCWRAAPRRGGAARKQELQNVRTGLIATPASESRIAVLISANG